MGEAPNKYLYCTVLFRTVLYKKEKICLHSQPQGTDVSKTEVHSTRELANKQTFQKLKSTLRGSWPILWLLMLAMSHPRKLVSVLYKKRKFAHKEQTDRQTDTQTFQKLKSTLFLYGSSPDTRG